MKHLLLLHGALGGAKQFDAFKVSFENTYKVHTVEFSGHGKTMFAGDFSIAKFAGEVVHYLDDNDIRKADIFGYSMGGFVSLYLASYFPERVGKIISLAAKLYWDEAIALKEAGMMNAEKIETKVPQFAAELKARHTAMGWKEHMQEAVAMMARLGADNPMKEDDYRKTETAALLLLGDRDKMVSLDETQNVFKLLPNAQFGVIPNTQHPFEQVNVPVLTVMVKQFLL